MATKVTLHFRDERADRATYIAQTIGFGDIIHSVECYHFNTYQIRQLTETGVMIIRSPSNEIITMFIAKPDQVKSYYMMNNLGRVPQWLATKVKKNWQKGYVKNQPDYH